MMEAIRQRANPSYIWSRRKYIFKLKWIHPEWLRALVALLIAAPLFLIAVFGFVTLFLLIPLVLAVKYFGIIWGFLLWVALYGYTSIRITRWLHREQKNRPRRSRVMH